MTRREIRALIRENTPWYQQIHLGLGLDTGSSFRWLVRRALGRRSQAELMLASLPDVRGRRVVDVGCNAGLYSLECSCRGAANVLGIERDPRMFGHARVVERIYRETGRPVGAVRFENADLMQRLDLLDDRDVLIACCVLYHLDPLAALQDAIAKSTLDTLAIQGNTAWCKPADGQPGVKHPDVAGIEGITRFVEGAGFRVESVARPDHQFPVIVARRA